MSGYNVKIAVEIHNVHIEVNGRLGAVDENGNAAGMHDSHNLLDGRDRA